MNEARKEDKPMTTFCSEPCGKPSDHPIHDPAEGEHPFVSQPQGAPPQGKVWVADSCETCQLCGQSTCTCGTGDYALGGHWEDAADREQSAYRRGLEDARRIAIELECNRAACIPDVVEAINRALIQKGAAK